MDELHSLQNPKLKDVVRLKSSPREIKKEGRTVIEGTHLIEMALATDQSLLYGVVARSVRDHPECSALIGKAMARSTPWYSIDDRLFEKLSDTVTPQGLLAVMALPAQRLPRPDQDFVVLLEDIQDPGNLGTLIRSAVACGVDAVVISKGSAEVWAPKVLRAGMGAHFSVTLVEGLDPVEFAQSFGGIAATTLRGTSAWEAPWAEIRGIAIGNEGAGLSSDLIAACAHNLTLPMAAGVESLNAAVAGSVLLFERMRSIRGRSSNPG